VNVETPPWADQFAVDDASFREQLAYLLERSTFYREKLAGVEPVGLADIAELPLTDKEELRATCTPENPIGTHFCAEPSELVRIYSTSGTTGTPSYVPLTASDLENWITGSARSYAASGISAGQRILSTYNAGPFVAGAALAGFERLGLCHIPFGTGNSERLVRAVEQLKPEAVVLTPSYAAHLAERNPELAASSACSSPASPAEASRRSVRSSKTAGARRSPRRWASATSVSRSGASARSRTGCTWAHAVSSTPS
jgi:phenylacetate-CoA ligase